MATSTITIRTAPDLAAKITALAQAMERSRNWVIEEALKQYVEAQEWQIEGIKQAQSALAQGEGIPFEEVMDEIDALIEEKANKRESFTK